MAKIQIAKKPEPAIALALPMGCAFTPVGLSLPKNLSADDWWQIGLILTRRRSQLRWALADWWVAGHRYGDRQQLVEGPDWDGPSFQTCMHLGTIARAFETCRRRQVLSIKHHAEVAGFAAAEADKWLDWCIATGEPGRSRSVADLRAEIARRAARPTRAAQAARVAESQKVEPAPASISSMPASASVPAPATVPASAPVSVAASAPVQAMPLLSVAEFSPPPATANVLPFPSPMQQVTEPGFDAHRKTDAERWEIVEHALLLGLETTADEAVARCFREARVALHELRGGPAS